ncbi:MAG: hypothetical protein J3R72DRAFT_453610 [Linnemannia gamsii]|nr:MAG: hypothetical protein J3R72DRAFT_453610 [Linnemannia gamsii]
MERNSYQELPSKNSILLSPIDSPSPHQAIPRASDEQLSSLFDSIPDFDASSNEDRNHILSSARRLKDTHAILIKICNDLNYRNYAMYSGFLRALLDSSREAWIPSRNLSHTNNPISLSLDKANTIPRAIEISRILIDYCIRMAKQEKNSLYVSPVLGSLHELVKLKELHTTLVNDTLRRLAFIPVENESIIINQAVVAHPLKSPWPLRKLDNRSIYDCQDENPVFRTESDINQGTNQDTSRDSRVFSYDVFETSFDLLWDVSGFQADVPPPSQNWLRTLMYTILFKSGIRSKVQVERHAFNLEMLDNPAIRALLEYKWNTIGHAYWRARFYVECLYYTLVLGAVITQVYGRIPRVSLIYVYILIIVMASVILLFKLSQFCRHRRFSPYGIINITVFALPLAGSVVQIGNIVNMNEKGDISLLSFSVLVIFLHCLFELRVKKRICYFVTVILEIVGQIRIFFLLFALGIVAFALTILHFLRGCPISDCGGLVASSFSKAPFRAISTTFLFLTGIWGSFGESLELEGRSWSFDLIMVFYVILMVMISLNVLIALMNDGFKEAKNTSTAAWIQFKLTYVEEAESLAYNIPGFRETYKEKFPDVIYYTATLQQQENHKKYFQKEDLEKQLETLMVDFTDVKLMLAKVLAATPSSA